MFSFRKKPMNDTTNTTEAENPLTQTPAEETPVTPEEPTLTDKVESLVTGKCDSCGGRGLLDSATLCPTCEGRGH